MQFGTTSWLLGGLYGGSLAGALWTSTHPQDTDNNSGATYDFDQYMNRVDSDSRIPIIYGTRKWGGQQTYHQTSSDRKSLTKDIVWCEGEIEGIYDVRADDMLVETITETVTTTTDLFTLKYIGSGTGIITKFNDVNFILYSNEGSITVPYYTVDAICGIINSNSIYWQATPIASTEIFSFSGDYISLSPNGLHMFTKTTTETIVIQQGLPGCSFTFSNGSVSQSPPLNYSTVGGYKNVAWSRFSLTAGSQLTSSNPTCTAIIKGMKVYDTRSLTKAYSSNPAMCVRDYLLSKRYGAGHFITADMLDEDSFKETADYCDALVTTRVPTTLATADAINAKILELQRYLQSPNISTEEQQNINDEIAALQNAVGTIGSNPVEYTLEVTPRYSLNIIIAETKSHVEILQDMFAVFGGFLVYANGRVSLRCEKATPVSYAFTDDTIVENSLNHTEYPIESSPNRYLVKFYDPSNEWTGVKVRVDNAVDQKYRKKIISKDVDLIGCTSQSQALRMARLYRDKIALNSIVVEFQTACMAMHLEPGDTITISKKIYPNGVEQWLFQDMPFRILEISEQKGIYSIKAEQYNESIYNDSLGAKIQVKNYIQIPDPFSGVVPSPTTFSLSEYGWQATDGTHVSTIVCDWDDVEYQFFRSYVVSLSTDNSTWTTLANTLTSNFTISNVQPQKYYVKIQVQNSVGRLSTAVVQEITIVGKDNPPGNVTGFSVSQAGEYISFAWDISIEPDIRNYEIRMGATWDNSELITQTTTVPYLWLAPGNGTYNFWIKAVDNFGNYSVTATVRSINIFGIAAKNVILSQTIDITDATSTGMYLSPYGYLELQTTDTYDLFADMFIGGNTYVTNAKVELPVVDLGANIIEQENYYIDPWGNVKVKTQETIGSTEFFSDIFSGGSTPVSIKYLAETFLSISPVYNSTPSTSVGIKYQTSIDGTSWSEEFSYLTRQFFGRYVKILLYPKSTQDLLHLKSVTITIDVPDVEDVLLNITIPAVKTYVRYNRKFYAIPNVAPIVEYGNGDTAIYRKSNITSDGFDLEILDSQGSLVSGVLVQANIRGY